MPSVYASWVGQSVILQVADHDSCVSLCGVIVGESETTVRIRVDEGWDMDIFKLMIFAVEQDNLASMLVN